MKIRALMSNPNLQFQNNMYTIFILIAAIPNTFYDFPLMFVLFYSHSFHALNAFILHQSLHSHKMQLTCPQGSTLTTSHTTKVNILHNVLLQ